LACCAGGRYLPLLASNCSKNPVRSHQATVIEHGGMSSAFSSLMLGGRCGGENGRKQVAAMGKYLS